MTKNNSVIRKMETADLSAVLLIEQEQEFPWSLTMLQDCLIANYECFVVVKNSEILCHSRLCGNDEVTDAEKEKNEEIIGFAVLSSKIEEAEILNIAIKANNQRQGLGKKLLEYIIKQAQEKNAKKLFLEVRESNKAALRLYQKFNFQQAGIRKDYYKKANGWENAIMMKLDLTILIQSLPA